MKDNWHDKQFASDWDSQNKVGNPTRLEQLDLLCRMVAGTYDPGTELVDLGFGSGQVEELLFKLIPDLSFIGVDSSAAMISQANERLKSHKDQFRVVIHDLADPGSLDLGSANISTVISVQTLHELTPVEKRAVFQYVRRVLQPGGYFLILDRFTLTKDLGEATAPAWQYLDDHAPAKSGSSFPGYLGKVAGKQDFTATPWEHIAWLRDAGLKAALLDLRLDRGIIAARKPL